MKELLKIGFIHNFYDKAQMGYMKNVSSWWEVEVSTYNHLKLLDFFYFVHQPVFYITQHFGNWIWCCPKLRGWEKPTPLGPLKWANLHHLYQG
jgi:hypothetical protein